MSQKLAWINTLTTAIAQEGDLCGKNLIQQSTNGGSHARDVHIPDGCTRIFSNVFLVSVFVKRLAL